MKSDYGQKYIDTYNDVCSAVEDVTSSIKGDSENTSQYRIIPMAKSNGKNMLINAVEFNSLNETVIFIGKQTIGVKLFSKNHIAVCSYSVSRKDGLQVVNIEYPDGTGMEQRYIYDATAQDYILDSTKITVFSKDFVNTDEFSDEIINDEFKVNVIFKQNPDNDQLKIMVNFEQKNDSYIEVYRPEEHPELLRIYDVIKENVELMLQTHINCTFLSCAKVFFYDISKFRKSFAEMLRIMEQKQKKDQEPNEL